MAGPNVQPALNQTRISVTRAENPSGSERAPSGGWHWKGTFAPLVPDFPMPADQESCVLVAEIMDS